MVEDLVSSPSVGDWFQRVAALDSQDARSDLVSQSTAFHLPCTVEAVHAEVLRILYTDPERAERLAQAGAWIAAKLNDDAVEALSARCTANVAFVRGDQEKAILHYERALKIFGGLGRDAEVGRTLTSGLQTLIYLGRYPQAFEWGRRAKEIFTREGDHLRLARLASNIGNILYRLDRHEDALANYQEAREGLERMGEPRDVAAVLSNIAVCITSLGYFAPAVKCYEEAREYCEGHGLFMLVAASDYNIAWLHYLRGDYADALKLYAATRRHCERAGDSYHMALCDLDESEIYLDLNLTEKAEELARRAAERFEKLQMGYERAKALVNEALAQSRQGEIPAAVRGFQTAREIFLQEGNEVWPAVITLYEAVIYYRQGRISEANRVTQEAWTRLSHSSLPEKSILCRLLQAQLHLEMKRPREAREVCEATLSEIERAGRPSLRFHASVVLGRVEEHLGNHEAAFRAYQDARTHIEDLRNRLWDDELRISILKDKAEVYESLVHLLLEAQVKSDASEREAFSLIQEAKSRSLADAISQAPGTNRPAVPQDAEVLELKRELNRHYRELEIAALCQNERTAERIAAIERLIAWREGELGCALGGAAGEVDALPFQSLVDAIPGDATLLEYYVARGTLYACLLTKDGFRIERLFPIERTKNALRLFQYQIEKFRLGHDYLRTFAGPLQEATRAHLQSLYGELIEPIRNLLRTTHLIIAPHRDLHQVPFHALHDGKKYLVDSFTLSTTPSAGVYARCVARPANTVGGDLVLGCLTARAPRIEEEVRAIAGMLPGSRLLIGDDATEANLREHAPECRYLHIASHGVFRRDNPAYSAIHLGDSHLTLHGLYSIPLTAELVALSGCSTGRNVVVGGDELIGLMRGLLQAGAQTLLLSLWDVDDGSATEFMMEFYRGLRAGSTKAESWREATLKLRDRYPHPWHWAPFTLIGKHT